MISGPRTYFFSALFAVMLPTVVWSQTAQDNAQILSERRFPTTFAAPSAIPALGGTGFIGLTYANPRQGVSGSDSDGDFIVGYTVGSPVENVSLTFGLAITGLDPFGEDGSFSISAARLLAVSETSSTFVGATASNIFAFGDADDADESYSVYVSHLTGIPTPRGEFPVQLTVGYGNEVQRDEDGLGTVDDGFFYAAGIGLTRDLSASFSGTETQLNIGLGVTMPDVPRLNVQFGVLDVTDNTNRQQFALSVTYTF